MSIHRKRLLHTCLLGALATGGASGVIAGCSSGSNGTATSAEAGVADQDAGGPGAAPIDGLPSDMLDRFSAGRAAFTTAFTPATGLGPLYTETACSDCHADGDRGPHVATRMAVVLSDGTTPSSDQSSLVYGDSEHPLVVAETGAHTPILPPYAGAIDGGADAGVVSIRETNRLGPPLYGRGYMEAVADSEIERMETQQATRGDGIHGRINHVTFVSQPDPDPTFDTHRTGDIVIGRFGLKARIASLDDFTADALQQDMGITSPMRPTEFKNPDGVSDDLKVGVDISADELQARSSYARFLAIPPRTALKGGLGWFENCQCNVCHAESLHTRADYPIAALANIDAPIYTDMLLHDMGDDLSDSVPSDDQDEAGPRDWRTSPLIGLRFSTSFLHDGRAKTIVDAIAAHDNPNSEASTSAKCYASLAPDFQQLILQFLQQL